MITENISRIVLNDFFHAFLQGCNIEHYSIVFHLLFPLLCMIQESKHHLNHAIKSFAQWQLNVMDMSDSVPAEVR